MLRFWGQLKGFGVPPKFLGRTCRISGGPRHFGVDFEDLGVPRHFGINSEDFGVPRHMGVVVILGSIHQVLGSAHLGPNLQKSPKILGLSQNFGVNPADSGESRRISG